MLAEYGVAAGGGAAAGGGFAGSNFSTWAAQIAQIPALYLIIAVGAGLLLVVFLRS